MIYQIYSLNVGGIAKPQKGKISSSSLKIIMFFKLQFINHFPPANLYFLFLSLQTCTTDLDCLELDRPTCCVRSRIGNHRVCKPLGGLFDQCNLRSQSFPWFGVREGYYCPCSIGLQCDNPGRLGERRRGQCGF